MTPSGGLIGAAYAVGIEFEKEVGQRIAPPLIEIEGTSAGVVAGVECRDHQAPGALFLTGESRRLDHHLVQSLPAKSLYLGVTDSHL